MINCPNQYLWIVCLFLVGCSYHYDQGQRLEEKKRWEEASIEYRLAFVEDPDDQDAIDGFKRTSIHAAKENMQRYREYLKEREYRKAYRRLSAAAIQDPQLEEAQAELKHWTKVLISGRVEFEFDQFSSSLHLADTMQFQIWLNTPTANVLKTSISNGTGYFFVEDLAYRLTPEQLAQYSLNAVGLAITKKTPGGITQKDFKYFVDLRRFLLAGTSGQLELSEQAALFNVSEHRPPKTSSSAWLPSKAAQYELNFAQQRIQVQTTEEHLQLLPSQLYINTQHQRAFVDFGSRWIRYNNDLQRWSLQKGSKSGEDYFYGFSKNLALYPYFTYNQGPFTYISVP